MDAGPSTLIATATLPQDHPTAMVFLDETGVVHPHPWDHFFGIGCLKLADHGPLVQRFQQLRQKAGLTGELHWAGFDKAATRNRPELVTLAKEAIDLVFDAEEAVFSCAIADRRVRDLTAPFRSDPHGGHKAYQQLAGRVLNRLVGEDEVLTVLADRLDTPPEVRFEREVARTVNRHHNRLAVAGVCRLDSRTTEGLQLVDLLLGAATFDLRKGRSDGEKQKEQIMVHLLDRCECNSFRPRGSEGANYRVEILSEQRRTRRGGRGGR